MNNAAREITNEEGFEPCRDERCTDEDGIHPAHNLDAERNSVACPLCHGDVCMMPKARARCVECQWRGDRSELTNKDSK